MAGQIRECAPSLLIDSIQHTYLLTKVRRRHLPLVITYLLSVLVIHQTSGCLVAWEILDKRLPSCTEHSTSTAQQIRPISDGAVNQPQHFLSPGHQTSQAHADQLQHMQGRPPKDAPDNGVRLTKAGRPA